MAFSRQTAGASAPDKDPVDAAYETWSRNPTPESMYGVVTALDGVTRNAIRTYGGAESPLLRGRARVLTAQAVRSFDPTRGAKLKTHVMSHLHGLARYAAQSPQVMPAPERLMLQRSSVQKHEDELRETLGRDPSDAELADRTGLSVTALRRMRQAAGAISAYGADTGADPTFYETDRDEALLDYVYHDLNDIDRKIVDWTMRSAALPKVEIARRLRISPAAVTQRARRIAARIAELEGLA